MYRRADCATDIVLATYLRTNLSRAISYSSEKVISQALVTW